MARKPAVKRNRLSEIGLDEISLVDRPANPGARLALFKRDGVADTATAAAIDAVLKDARSFNEVFSTTDLEEEWWDLSRALRESIMSILADATASDKKALIGASIDQFKGAVLGEVSGQVSKGTTDMTDTVSKADHDKAVAELTAKLAKAETDAKVASLSTEHRAHYDGLGDAAKADFLAKSDAERSSIVKAASALPDHVSKTMEDLRKANEDLKARVDKAEDEKRDVAALAKAKELLGDAGGDATELAAVIKGLDEAGVATLAKQFEAQRTFTKFAGGKDAFKPVGKTATSTGASETVAKATLAGKVEDLRKADPKLSREQAELRVLETNPELYSQMEGAAV